MAEFDEVERVLGDPVIDDLPELAQNLRRNLLISSSFSHIYCIGNIRIERTSPLGIEISGLSNSLIEWTLLLIVTYNLMHFVWHCIDYLGIWRIHLTGTRLHFQTGTKWASGNADYPEDPKQSNLYRWWQEKAREIGSLSSTAKAIEETASQLSTAAERCSPSADASDRKLFSQHADLLRKQAVELNGKIREVGETIRSHRPSASLKRYDRWFKSFKKSQLIRLFVIEFGLPSILGIFAIIAVFARML